MLRRLDPELWLLRELTLDREHPPHLMPLVADHLIEHTERGRDALLFPSATDPGRQMAPSGLYAVFFPAREKAGRPDLNFHDLRHTGPRWPRSAAPRSPS
jgi:integrase